MTKQLAEKKDYVLYVRFSKAEYDYAKAQAASAGVTVSAFIRAAACGLSVQTKADAQILRELRRLGGLCKHAINEGAHTQTCADTFKALRDYAASII